MPQDERLLRTVLRRLDAVLQALRDPDAEAARFLRRHQRASAPHRPPLAFGRPPGLKAAASDPVLAANLATSDRAAEAAWAKLCDTS